MAKEIHSSAIAAANSSFTRMMELCQRKRETRKRRGEYQVYTGKEKVKIAKRILPSSIIFDWKEQYLQELQKTEMRRKGGL